MKKKALFLDRDGVVNLDIGYGSKSEDIVFVPGIFDICREAVALGYVVIIVTNQSGIGRGYYSEAEFQQLTDWIARRFAEEQCPITHTYYCPHHPEAAVEHYRKKCDCRKPNPGMILSAISDYCIDPDQSLLIGDKPRDIISAQSAGIAQQLLFAPENDALSSNPTAIIKSLADAKTFLNRSMAE